MMRKMLNNLNESDNRSMVQSIVFKGSDALDGFHLWSEGGEAECLTSFPAVGHDVILTVGVECFSLDRFQVDKI